MEVPTAASAASPGRLRALWFELYELRCGAPTLRRACEQVAQPFTPEAVRQARQSDERESKRALHALELSIIRVGAYVDDLLLHAWRARQRATHLCSADHAWRWALAQDHGLSMARAARLQVAAATARELVRSAEVSEGDLYCAAHALTDALDSAVVLVLAAWSRSR